jgi:hypothetical protein
VIRLPEVCGISSVNLQLCARVTFDVSERAYDLNARQVLEHWPVPPDSGPAAEALARG